MELEMVDFTMFCFFDWTKKDTAQLSQLSHCSLLRLPNSILPDIVPYHSISKCTKSHMGLMSFPNLYDIHVLHIM